MVPAHALVHPPLGLFSEDLYEFSRFSVGTEIFSTRGGLSSAFSCERSGGSDFVNFLGFSGGSGLTDSILFVGGNSSFSASTVEAANDPGSC